MKNHNIEKFNKIYLSPDIDRDIISSQTINIIWKSFLPNSEIIDLGCGTGADSLFLSMNNFSVSAVDNSDVAISKLITQKNKLNLATLKPICDDINNFKIVDGKYDVIICRNVLNFLNKKNALKLINKIKSSCKSGAYIIIDVFTKNDPSFLNKNKFDCYFEEQELLEIFSGFKIINFFEDIILDNGHQGYEFKHKHGVSKIIVQK